ncbi:hypothetical protein EDC04DRAFT_2870836 [Pisolithus marmoratus]|nr:hypothetical protein EDC04DRAFT_2870836 [Pisolithus marmoratus]
MTAPAASHSTNHPPDFKTEFHPRSKRPTLYQSFEDFGQQIPEDMAPVSEPWRPFASEGDYIFAMIAVEAGLTSTQVDSLLTLFHRIKQGMTSSQFLKFEITAPYKGEGVMFQVHACWRIFSLHHPLWDWALDLLQNPSLAPHFVWDAQWLFKHDGEKYERFYTEPWTGDRWWDIQVHSYPVVARCANLPVHIHNGEQYGGGCIVGWLPIVPELMQEERKTGYANFKRTVWHEAFFKLLKKVTELSKVGYLYECYDKVLRWLFPIILILSADYEELCVMTLIRGTKCKCPCLFCLVPSDRLWDLSKTYEMRTSEQHKEALAAYMDKKSVGEQKLKFLGLCPLKNIFWSVEHSEPEQAASFEPLHSLHGGMGSKHMHEELKIALSELGRDFETKLEEQVSAFPRWQGLAHFDTVIHITFSDRNKMRDVTRQCFYTALNILMTEGSPAGYQLLRMMRSYLQLDSLIGLDVQTKKTISMIENELIVFRDELKVSTSSSCEYWNFPKAHLWKHVTRDIQSKGAIRNYSARPNEKMHGPLKDAYQDCSNGKDVAGQILHVDHHRLVIKLIQVCIDAENERTNLAAGDDAGNNEDNGGKFEENTKLGTPQQPTSLSDIETAHKDDRAFDGFHQKLETFLNTCLPTYGYPLNEWIQLQGTHMVHEYRYLKVKHVSMVDWEITTSHLRCSPNFHDFNLIRVKAVSHASSIFIPVKSIIRGALLYPDPNRDGEFLVVEHIDSDMFLRMKEWTRTRHRASKSNEIWVLEGQHLNECDQFRHTL